jgi:Ca2+-binding RTX toxin-like protein
MSTTLDSSNVPNSGATTAQVVGAAMLEANKPVIDAIGVYINEGAVAGTAALAGSLIGSGKLMPEMALTAAIGGFLVNSLGSLAVGKSLGDSVKDGLYGAVVGVGVQAGAVSLGFKPGSAQNIAFRTLSAGVANAWYQYESTGKVNMDLVIISALGNPLTARYIPEAKKIFQIASILAEHAPEIFTMSDRLSAVGAVAKNYISSTWVAGLSGVVLKFLSVSDDAVLEGIAWSAVANQAMVASGVLSTNSDNAPAARNPTILKVDTQGDKGGPVKSPSGTGLQGDGTYAVGMNSKFVNTGGNYAASSNIVAKDTRSGNGTPSNMAPAVEQVRKQAQDSANPQNATDKYKVQASDIKINAGDTLSELALKAGVTVKDMMDANPQITNADKIYAGDTLTMPDLSHGESGGVENISSINGIYFPKTGATLNNGYIFDKADGSKASESFSFTLKTDPAGNNIGLIATNTQMVKVMNLDGSPAGAIALNAGQFYRLGPVTKDNPVGLYIQDLSDVKFMKKVDDFGNVYYIDPIGSAGTVAATVAPASQTYASNLTRTFNVAAGVDKVEYAGSAAWQAFSGANTVLDLTKTKGVTRAFGNQGNDTLIGTSGNDYLEGSAGSDTFKAGAGEDVLVIDAADALKNIDGGAGIDTVIVASGGQGIALNLYQTNTEVVYSDSGDDVIVGGGADNYFVDGGAGDDIIVGGSVSDALSGGDGNDIVDGGDGNDLLRGGRGDDTVRGGSGDDVLDGGLGNDILGGGAGNDVFISGGGTDTIDGGDGTDLLKLRGSLDEYRLVKNANGSYTITDSIANRDGVQTISHVEKLSFQRGEAVMIMNLSEDAPLPVDDQIKIAANAATVTIASSTLLGNDLDLQHLSQPASYLSITWVGDVLGGTATLSADKKNITFTRTAGYLGPLEFAYEVKDERGVVGMDLADGIDPTIHGEMKGRVLLVDPSNPSDPGYVKQWYLGAIGAAKAWQHDTGKGVKVLVLDPSGPFAVANEVADLNHADLVANKSDTFTDTTDHSAHATLVAGVIGAARNGIGTVGVAYGATLDSIAFKPNDSASVLADMRQMQNYDVVNNSWLNTNPDSLGWDSPTKAAQKDYYALQESAIQNAALSGRDGLGTIMVFGAGNDRSKGYDSGLSNLTNNFYTIDVAAINRTGDIGLNGVNKPFSERGANILVAAPGSNIVGSGIEFTTPDGTNVGDALQQASGTSLATPIVSGVVALMLEANSQLSYRDVQTILANTARKDFDPNSNQLTTWGVNKGLGWNGTGMHFSSDFGFGMVDAAAAVRMAETWDVTWNFTKPYLWTTTKTSTATAPLDMNKRTLSFDVTSAAMLEQVSVDLQLNHARWSDLIITLISPKGTRSTLLDRVGVVDGVAGLANPAGVVTFDKELMSTQFRGESSVGTWQLEVQDAASGTPGTGDVTATLHLVGPDAGVRQYIVTDEYASAPAWTISNDAAATSRELNAAAVSGVVNVNLSTKSGTIAGKAITLATVIDRLVGGAANDTLTGSAGTEVFAGGQGNDTIDGGAGSDVAIFTGKRADAVISYNSTTSTYTVTTADNGTDTVKNIETFRFTGEAPGATDYKAANGVLSAIKTADTAPYVMSAEDVADLAAHNAKYPSPDYSYSATLSNTHGGYVFGEGSQGGNAARRLLGANAVDANGYLKEYFAGTTLDGYGSYNVSHHIGDITLDRSWINFANLDYSSGIHYQNIYDNVNNGTGFVDPHSVMGWAQSANWWVDAGNGGYVGTSQAILSADSMPWAAMGWDHGITLTGTSEDDTIKVQSDVGSVAMRVSGGDGNDIMVIDNTLPVTYSPTLAAGRIMLDGGAGDDVMVGGNSNDLMDGGTGNDVMDGGLGMDLLLGGDGNDVINGGSGNDIIYGGAGDDKIYGDTGNTLVNGADIVASHDDYISGGDGNDRIYGESGSDTLMGGAGNDVLDGGAGGDYLQGGAGNDTLYAGGDGAYLSPRGLYDLLDGGAGDDTYVLTDNTNIIILEAAGGGTDTVISDVSYNLSDTDGPNDRPVLDQGYGLTNRVGNSIENLTLRGTADLTGTGNALNNVITGNAGDNVLDGGTGNDTLIGGAGNDTLNGGTSGTDRLVGGTGDDTYVLTTTGDTVVENAGEGIDTVKIGFAGGYTMAANVEKLIMTGYNLTATGNVLDNTMTSLGGKNTLNGGEGNDTLYGGTGNDTLNGGAGDDTLNGGTGGTDRLVGGTGNDTYVLTTGGDTIVEDVGAAGGIDTVKVGFSGHLLEANVENLIMMGSADLTAKGNELNNVMTGNDGDNVLDGGAGNDTLIGGIGNDTLYGGTSGTDSLVGGAGDDIYVLSTGWDKVVESAGEGIDTVKVGFSGHVLESNVENLIMTSNNLTATGNALDNTMTSLGGNNILNGGDGDDTLNGGAGNDTLIGGAGNDTLNGGTGGISGIDRLVGGLGNDTYVLTTGGDAVVESEGEGYDTVKVGFSGHLLESNVENLILMGSADLTARGNELNNIMTGNDGDNVLDGGTGNDTLIGGAGNDTLNGGAGNDSMSGGAGDDTYVVDSTSDVITEASNGGTDTVQSSVSYTLVDYVENLVLTGSANLTGKGNGLNNIITGNSGGNTLYGYGGNDTLNGGSSGTDTLYGGLGDDTYVLGTSADTVIELANEGTDTVQSGYSYTLGAYVENLVLTGSANLTGKGNGLNNIITGNSGANTLYGYAGNDTLNGGSSGTDTLYGGVGDDTYVLGTSADTVIELANEGTDTVQSGYSYTLGTYVENLVLTGAAGLAGTGNSGNNMIVGNSANNTLTGGLGIDVLFGGSGDDILTEANTDASNALLGGAGNDTLTSGVKADFLAGGAGNDTFTLGSGADILAFNAGDGADTVNTVTGSSAVLSLGGGIKLSDLSLQKSGSDLIVNTNAAKTEKLTLKNWYAATPQTGLAKLQLMVDASTDYLATSADKLKNKRIDTLNFQSVVSAFNSSGTATGNAWSVMNASLSAYLAGSDNMALGGELAYQYGHDNTPQLALGTAQTQLNSASFGSSTQSVTVGLNLPTGQMGLSG